MSAALVYVWQSVSLTSWTRPAHVAQVSSALLTACTFHVINKASSCGTSTYHTSHRLYLWRHKQGQLMWQKYLSHSSLPTFFSSALVKGEPANNSFCCSNVDRTTTCSLQSEILIQFLRWQACWHLCLGFPLTSWQSCQVLTNSWENWRNRGQRDFCPTAHPPKQLIPMREARTEPKLPA